MLQEVKCDHTAAKFNCILQQLLKTIIQCPYFSNLDRVTRIKLDHRAALKCDYLITFSLGLLQQAEVTTLQQSSIAVFYLQPLIFMSRT